MAAPINIKIARAYSTKIGNLTKSVISVSKLVSLLFYFLVETKDKLM